jgi:hypothetical protein
MDYHLQVSVGVEIDVGVAYSFLASVAALLTCIKYRINIYHPTGKYVYNIWKHADYDRSVYKKVVGISVFYHDVLKFC